MATAAEVVTSIRIDSSSLAADAATVRGVFAALRQDIDRSLSANFDLGKIKIDASAIAAVQQQMQQLAASATGGIPFMLNPRINQQQLRSLIASSQATASAQPGGVRAAIPIGAAGVIAQARAQAQPQSLGSPYGVNRVASMARNVLLATGAGVALALHEYAKAEEADSKLRSALAATGQEVEKNHKRFNEFANSLERTTTLANEDVKSLGTLALNLGVSAENLQEVVKAGIGLGQTLFGGNFQQGTKAAALAVQGQTRQLQALIPALRNVKNEQEILTYVNQRASIGLREMQLQANTFSGSMKTVRRDVREAAEIIGQLFVPEMRNAGEHIRKVAAEVRGMTSEQKSALKTAGEAAIAGSALLALGTQVWKVFRSVGSALGTNASTVLKVLGAWGLALTGIGALYISLRSKHDDFSDRVVEATNKTTANIEQIGKAVGGAVGKARDTVLGEFDLIAFRAKQLFDGLAKGEIDLDFSKADKAYADYLVSKQQQRDQDAAHDNAQHKADVAATQAALNQEVNATEEASGKMRASYSSLKDYYRKTQEAILNDTKSRIGAEAAAQKQGDNAKRQQPPATQPTTPTTGTPTARIIATARPAVSSVQPTTPKVIGTPAARVIAAAREQRDVRAESEERRQQMQADLDALRDLEALEQRTPSFRDNAVHERLKKKLRDRIVENRRFIEGEGDVQKAISGEVAERDRAAARQTTRPMEDAKRRIELMRKNLDDEAKALEAGGGFVSEESGRVVNRAGRIDTKAFRMYAGKLLDEYTNQQLRAAREEEEKIRASAERKIQDRAQPNRVRVRQALERALPSIGSAVNTVLNLTSTPTAPLALRNPQQPQIGPPAQQETMRKFSDGTDKLSKAADGMQDAADDIKSVFKQKQQIYVVEDS